MKICFIPPSDQELEDAMDYYDTQTPGLGNEFYQMVMKTVERIQKFPHSWRKVGNDTHRINISRFP